MFSARKTNLAAGGSANCYTPKDKSFPSPVNIQATPIPTMPTNLSAPQNVQFDTRRLDRRSFLHKAGLIAALTPAAAMLLGVKSEANADELPYPISTELDIAILNFALNLEYLEGEYYSLGAYGKSLTDLGVTLTGSGTQGDVTVKTGSPQVPFATAALRQYAEEIANDEIAHINFIRGTIAGLGGTPVAHPAVDLLNSFNTVADMAGIAATFDPFTSETNFFLGGFSLTDVGVTAYHGSAPYLKNLAVISGAAGLLGTESYHDAVLRLTVYQAGSDAQEMASKISDFRDKIDDNNTVERDQGVVDSSGGYNIVPADTNSIAFARKPGNVLNIVCGGNKQRKGGFFPNGVNGPIQ